MPLYSFTYGIAGVLYDPVNPSIRVRAHSLFAARRKAQKKFAAILAEMRREKWVWESKTGWDQKDGKWVYYPARKVKGRLWRGHVVEKQRFYFDKAFSFPVDIKGAEAIAAVLAQPLLQVIQQAPVLTNMFSKTPDASPSIPFIWSGKTVYRKPKGWKPEPVSPL